MKRILVVAAVILFITTACIQAGVADSIDDGKIKRGQGRWVWVNVKTYIKDKWIVIDSDGQRFVSAWWFFFGGRLDGIDSGGFYYYEWEHVWRTGPLRPGDHLEKNDESSTSSVGMQERDVCII